MQPQSYHLWCLSHMFSLTSMLSFPFPQLLRVRQSFWTPHFLLFPLFNPLAGPSKYNQIWPLLTTTTATTMAQVSIIPHVLYCIDSLPGLPTPASSIKQPCDHGSLQLTAEEIFWLEKSWSPYAVLKDLVSHSCRHPRLVSFPSPLPIKSLVWLQPCQAPCQVALLFPSFILAVRSAWNACPLHNTSSIHSFLQASPSKGIFPVTIFSWNFTILSLLSYFKSFFPIFFPQHILYI